MIAFSKLRITLTIWPSSMWCFLNLCLVWSLSANVCWLDEIVGYCESGKVFRFPNNNFVLLIRVLIHNHFNHWSKNGVSYSRKSLLDPYKLFSTWRKYFFDLLDPNSQEIRYWLLLTKIYSTHLLFTFCVWDMLLFSRIKVIELLCNWMLFIFTVEINLRKVDLVLWTIWIS